MLSVAVGVIRNDKGEILIAKRPANKSHSGLWEYPGGKQQNAEHISQTLSRELYEELNIHVQAARPLIRIANLQQQVLLDVWQVEAWSGAIYGKEGQEIYWCKPAQLSAQEFLPANQAITTAIKLPSIYLITPDPLEFQTKNLFLYQLERSLQHDNMLVQFRANQLNLQDYYHYAEAVLQLCDNYNIPLLLNNTPEVALKLGAAGVHLNSIRLQQQLQKNRFKLLVSASCHTAEDIQQANKFADFMLLSPVKFTYSHPQAKIIGWHKFWQLTELANIPVFALGGMQLQHLPIVWAHGGQGIAAIRSLWIAS